jgi:hypothetical protein
MQLTTAAGLLGLFVGVWLLTACSSEDVKLKLADDWGQFSDKTKVQLINASLTPLDFHLASFSETNGAPVISDPKYHRGSLEVAQAAKDVEVKRSYTNHKLSIQVFEMLNKAPGEFQQISSAPEKPLQVIAWQDESKVRISVLRRESSSQNGVYRLRVLAVANEVQVKVGSAQVSLLKGQLSDWFSLQQCYGDLQLNNKALNLCQATAGQSFLAVLDTKQILSLTQI